MTSKILIVEDDPDIVEVLRYNLKREGFEAKAVNNGTDGIKCAITDQPDLILLDLLLPEVDGLTVCQRLRSMSSTKSIPIIMLTAKGEEADRIVGLEYGADDYIPKPFSVRELLLRIQAVLRRMSTQPNDAAPNRIEFDDVAVNLATHQVFNKTEEIILTATEFKLLTLLASSPGRIFTRDVLMDALWGSTYYGVDRSMDKHVSRLRQKLGASGQRIETVYKVGYRFRE